MWQFKKDNAKGIVLIVIVLVISFPTRLFAWSSLTHEFIAKKAGIPNPQYSNLPDIIKKENYPIYGPLHWHDAAPNTVVTPDYIDQFQITEGYYVKKGSPESKPIKLRVPDAVGVLYWEILQLYQEMKKAQGSEYEYYLYSIAHFVGDLSQPLHNFPFDNNPASNGVIYPEIGQWSRKNHHAFDDSLDHYLPLDVDSEKVFDAMITVIQINSIDDLKKEIAKIANESIKLANKCYSEKRPLTKQEGLRQIAMSVSLLKGIVASTNSNNKGGVR